MSTAPWYEGWFNSPYYHKLYFERDEKEAAAFIERMAEKLALAPGQRLLDVACGRGRHSRIFAGLGLDVTGIDLSPASIEFAKKYESDHLHFFVHDMRLPLTSNYYDFAVNLFTSFGYFRTQREHDASIRTIASSLKPGGLLLIDYLNVHYSENRLVAAEEKTIDDIQYNIRRWMNETHFFKSIRVSDLSGKELYACTEQVAKFTLGDFTGMLGFFNMQVQEVWGDYNFGPYDVRNAPRLLVLARKGEPGEQDREKRLYSDGRRTDALT